MTDVASRVLLERAAQLSEGWSRQAEFWRQVHFRGRMQVLYAGLFTALVGAGVTSLGLTNTEAGLFFKALAVLAPLMAAFATAYLGMANVARKWVAFRAAAEMLKSEAYLYAAGVEHYAGPDRDQVLEERLRALQEDLAGQTGGGR
jgi:hypothetical protein